MELGPGPPDHRTRPRARDLPHRFTVAGSPRPRWPRPAQPDRDARGGRHGGSRV